MTFALACTGPAEVPATRSAAHRSAITFRHLATTILPADGQIGGLSGLEVQADGARFVAVSDQGTVVRGRLDHRPDGVMTRVAEVEAWPLGGAGTAKRTGDAEALTQLADGSWLVAFERQHRIMRYAPGAEGLTGRANPLDLPPGAAGLPRNSGIETLAASGDDLVAIAESAGGAGHPAWLRQNGEWRRTRFEGRAGFDPTDAAFLPDGSLLVLLRSFSLLGGFRTRLALVPAEDLAGASSWRGNDLGAITPPDGPENFEGLAVRADEEGRLFAYLISDDNFSPLQRTLLVQYLIEGSATGGR